MKVIVLTGGIASGKSAVSAVLAGMGVPVIDADRVAREVVEPGREAYREIVEAFGRGVLHKDGTIDRERLGRLVFADGEQRKTLERITHPRIGARVADLLAAHAADGAPAVVLDIPLYIETRVRAGAPESQRFAPHLQADAVIVVTADEPAQLERLMTRDGLSREDALARISSQIPLSEKAAHADYVIDNSGTPAETEHRVREVWELVLKGPKRGGA
jgi:dephospho-CoA kinase